MNTESFCKIELGWTHRSTIVRYLVLLAAFSFAAPCSAIEKADFWVPIGDPIWGGQQWWINRPPETPGTGHLTNVWVSTIVIQPDPLDFKISDLLQPATDFALSGFLGVVDSDTTVLDDGITRLETSLSGARFTLLKPIAADPPVANATIDAGTVTGDMTGHRLLVDEGSFSFVEFDAANNVIGSDQVDFSATPMELLITSGSAIFSSSLSGNLSLQFETDMSEGHFGAEEVMLTFDFELDATARLPGDLDGDGFVGIGDLNIVLSAWNQSVPPGNTLADPTGDGFVGIEDLNVVLGNWNAGTPPADTANIPEPGVVGVMVLGVGGYALNRKRGRG